MEVTWNQPARRALTATAIWSKEEDMREARYFLVRRGDDWMIEFDNEEYGPYRSRSEAMLFAVDAAQKLGEHGDRAQVCLMGEDGHFRPEWTYGEDRYPPQV
jgi:Uncharacterized protein conserved in bacteria (DUF2188)